MRLKSFHAKSMHDALKQVKDALGDDAIIVSTKEEASGWVRITAAVEQLAPSPEAVFTEDAPAAVPPQKAGKPMAEAAPAAHAYDPDEVIEIVTDTMLKHRVPAAISEKIITAASLDGSGDPIKALAKGLARTFTFVEPQNPDAKRRPIILAGPPGAGKTLMTAKLATDAVMHNKKPVIITTDIARAGGVEQLSAFLNILELPLHQAESAAELQSILKQSNGCDVIIDTGGLNPFDPQEMKFLAKLLATGDMDAALVMPAGMDAEEAAEIAMTFDVLGVKNLIATRLDFARRLGGILSAAAKTGLSLGTASHTPQVAHGIIDLTPQKLAALLLPHLPEPDATAKAKGR